MKAGYTPAHIPEASFQVLQSALLRSIQFEVHTWDRVCEDLIAHFKDMLAEDPLLAGLDWDPTVRVNEWKCFLPDTDETSIDEDLARIAAKGLKAAASEPSPQSYPPGESPANKKMDEFLARLRKYLGQYRWSLQVGKTYVAAHQGTGYRISIKHASELPNHVFYELDPAAPSASFLNFGTSFRVRFELVEFEGKPTIRISNEDRISNDWHSASMRSFALNMVDRNSAISAINFLISTLT